MNFNDAADTVSFVSPVENKRGEELSLAFEIVAKKEDGELESKSIDELRSLAQSL